MRWWEPQHRAFESFVREHVPDQPTPEFVELPIGQHVLRADTTVEVGTHGNMRLSDRGMPWRWLSPPDELPAADRYTYREVNVRPGRGEALARHWPIVRVHHAAESSGASFRPKVLAPSPLVRAGWLLRLYNDRGGNGDTVRNPARFDAQADPRVLAAVQWLVDAPREVLEAAHRDFMLMEPFESRWSSAERDAMVDAGAARLYAAGCPVSWPP